MKPALGELEVGQKQKVKAEEFKYLSFYELTPNISRKKALISRTNKMEMAYHVMKTVFATNDQSPSMQSCLKINRMGLTVKLGRKERKILGPARDHDEYRRRHTQELYT